MPRTLKRLYGPAQLSNSAATIYTVPGATTAIIKQIHLQNPSVSAVTFTLSIGTDAAGKRLYDALSIPAGGVVDLWEYIPMAATEVIQAFADTASTLVITIGGDERT